MICAERTAACSYSGVELDRLDGAAAVHVGAELVALGDAAHRRDDPVADDEGADVAAPALADEALDEHVLLRAVQGLDDRLGDLDVGREDDADALRALEQLDDDRRAADTLDRRHARRRGCARTSSAGIPMLWRERICVARSLSRALVMPFAVFGRVDVHLLELPHDGGAEVGDRVADARQDRVVVGQLPAAELQVGLRRR